MIIRSRPPKSQACEPIVEQAIRQLYALNRNTGNMQTVINLDQYERMLRIILNTLQLAGTLTEYAIGAAHETSKSTYEKEEWLIRIKFTDDPAKKVGYIAELLFHYNRA